MAFVFKDLRDGSETFFKYSEGVYDHFSSLFGGREAVRLKTGGIVGENEWWDDFVNLGPAWVYVSPKIINMDPENEGFGAVGEIKEIEDKED